MRCANLADTWAALCSWFNVHEILVLPPLHTGHPLVRLDADVDQGRLASPAELDLVVGRLQAVLERFGVRAVYVHESIGEFAAPAPYGGGRNGNGAELSVVTVRTVAGGVVHELQLLAGPYAESLDRMPSDG